MRRISLYLGSACNCNCIFCSVGRNVYDEHTEEEVACILKNAVDEGASELVLTGGEPTMRSDLPRLVRTAVDLGFTTVQLQTNGRLLYYRASARKLVDAGVTEFIVTVAGHTAALHDGQTRARGSLDQTRAGIRNLRALGAFVAANVVATSASTPHLPEIVRSLLALDVSQVQVAFPEPAGNAYVAMDEVVPRLDVIRGPLGRSIALVLSAERFATLEGFPFCAAPNHVQHAVEWCEIERGGPTVWERRSRPEPCRSCTLFDRCPGMWSAYLDRHGHAELRPVTACL